MDDPHLIVAESSTGFDERTATFPDGPVAALDEAEQLQSLANESLTWRVFRLVEVRRGHVPANEVLDMGD